MQAYGTPVKFTPGTKFERSIFGYKLLGKILEAVTGKKYYILARNLLNRLHMHDTHPSDAGYFSAIRNKYPNLVRGFSENKEGNIIINNIRHNTDDNPAAGFISNANDLIKWNLNLMTSKVVKDNFLQKMLSPQVHIKNHRWGKMTYGYGIQIDYYDGIVEYSNSGTHHGYTSSLIYYPNYHLSIVVLENISYQKSNIKRAFSVHDKIRSLVRQHIILNKRPD